MLYIATRHPNNFFHKLYLIDTLKGAPPSWPRTPECCSWIVLVVADVASTIRIPCFESTHIAMIVKSVKWAVVSE